MTNDLLKGIMSEEELKELIGNKVSEVIENEITYEVRQVIENKIKAITEEKVREVLNKEIDSILKGEIIINDGWGSRKRYDSFEDMFKKEVKEQLNNYNFERTIEGQIRKKIENIFKNELNGVSELIENTLLERFNLGGKINE